MSGKPKSEQTSRLASDLRAEAEARVASKRQAQLRSQARVPATPGAGTGSAVQIVDTSVVANATPTLARLAELDYRLNGGRARSNTGDFVPPRWVLDEEVTCCQSCKCEFDWVNRRHHCRHCGNIYCDSCSSLRSLLPMAFGQCDPQRVCDPCHRTLAPMQQSLTNVIANHQRVNAIDLTEKLFSLRYCNLPYSNTLGAEIRKAAYAVHNLFTLQYVKDKAMPLQLLAKAHGVAFITVLKAGWTLAPRFGTGLVVAKLPDGTWSAPSAVCTVGCSWGALVGADVTDYVLVLTSKEAVELFCGSGGILLGAAVEVALGPVGRAGTGLVGISDTSLSYSPSLSYSHARGLYAGASLDLSVVFARGDVNHNFYGRPVTPQDILRGSIPPPRAAQPLYDQLFNALSTPLSTTAAYRTNHTAYGVAANGMEAERPTQALSPMAPRYDIVRYEDIASKLPPVELGTGGML